MNKTAPTCELGAPNWGSFALVTYLPDPLGTFLTELRQLLPGENQAEAHITFLPPRSLSLPVNAACREIEQKLGSVEPFELELGEVRVFPETNMLYLSVGTGHSVLLRLHKLLNNGGLSAEEQFEFVPHLTLGGPLVADELEAICERTARAWEKAAVLRSFVVSEIVLLWQPGVCSERNWTRMSSFPLVETSQDGSLQIATQT